MENMRFNLQSRSGTQATKPVHMQEVSRQPHAGSSHGAREHEARRDEGGCMEYGALTTHLCDTHVQRSAAARLIGAR